MKGLVMPRERRIFVLGADSYSLGSRMTIFSKPRVAWTTGALVLALLSPACKNSTQSQGQSLCNAYCEKVAACSVEAGQLSSDGGTLVSQAVGFCENVTCLCPDQSDVLAALSACASQDCSAIGACSVIPPCTSGGTTGAGGSTGLGGTPGEGGSFGSGGSFGTGGSIGVGGSI
jgi:hypothetical protein